MGLYLAVFASRDVDDEVDGVEVGSYDDFHALRSAVCEHLEDGRWGTRFPTFMSHSDSTGEWSSTEAGTLAIELNTIATELSRVPAPPQPWVDGTWQAHVAKLLRLRPASLADTFIDVDGEPLLERIAGLATLAAERMLPITFQ